MEPIRRKLRRWILGEDNLPPPSITEQSTVQPITGLTDQQNQQLQSFFVSTDAQLHFGFTFKFLFRIYKAMGLSLSDEERLAFTRQIGYHRKVNQDSCSMTLGEFTSEVERRAIGSKQEGAVEFVDRLCRTANDCVAQVV